MGQFRWGRAGDGSSFWQDRSILAGEWADDRGLVQKEKERHITRRQFCEKSLRAGLNARIERTNMLTRLVQDAKKVSFTACPIAKSTSPGLSDTIF